MTVIDIAKLKELRERTHVSVGTCKEALVIAQNDIDRAIEWLKVKGALRSQDLTSRVTSSGAVISYVHPGNLTGAMVQVTCETDFVARSDEFLTTCRDIAMHITASKPRFIKEDDARNDEGWRREKGLILLQLLEDPKMQNKTKEMLDKIGAGKCAKALKDVCLLTQPFVKDPTRLVNDLINDLVLRTGEKIAVIRFSRFDVRE